MAQNDGSRDRLREITESIEQGIKELFESEKYMQYLRVMSRFHRYKVEEIKRDPDTKAPVLDRDGNVVMEEKDISILRFKAVSVFDVSHAEGKPFPQLASDLTGSVQDYEIFMEALRRASPVPLEIRPIQENMDGYFDPENQIIALRDDMSEVQTVCAAIHEISHAKLHNNAAPIPADAPKYELVEILDQPALFDNARIDAAEIPDGLFRYDLRGSDDDPGMPIALEQKVLVNHAGTIITTQPLPIPENGYLLLTEDDGLNFLGEEMTIQDFQRSNQKDRHTEEVEAESISYTVCQYYGIETRENSFSYIANWSSGKELPELRASLETIQKTANGLIADIDRHFMEICKERGIDLPVHQESAQMSAAQAAAIDEYPMPDEALNVAALEARGYMDGDMLPLFREQAMELFEKKLTVYAIVNGGDTEMLFDREDFDTQAPETLFAVPREEWEASPLFHEKVMERHDHQEEREAAFLAHERDCFAIYQVIDDDPQHLRFMNMDWLQSHGLTVERANYDLVYTGELTADGNTGRTLEALYEQFNLHHPADYHHPSMSVSDIVAVKQNGVISCHYCDSFGFQEISGFLTNPLRNAEMALEDDYDMIDGIINNGPKEPTVAELEQQARSDQSVHREQQEKKKSVVEQLKAKPKQEHKKAAPERSAEREL